MRYIKFLLHTDYSGAVLTTPFSQRQFKKGTIAYLNPNNELIFIEDVPVCYMNSYVSHEYFCRDDDEQGWLRHAYTYAIAKANRQRILSDGAVSRFTEEESNTITNRWGHFIRQDCPGVILFNTNFFNATIEDLQQMAKEINIKVKLNDINDSNNNSNKDLNNDSNENTNENTDTDTDNESVKGSNKGTNKDENTDNNEVKIVNNVVIKK